MKTTITLLLQIICMTHLFAQHPMASNLVKQNTHYFEINGSSPNGKGFEILKKEIAEVQFVILVEEHFSAKISEFTNAMVPILKENEFNYFAAEIGPNSAATLTELNKTKKSLHDFNTEIYDLVGEVPIPFFDGKEDALFLHSFFANGFELWGLDQECKSSTKSGLILV